MECWRSLAFDVRGLDDRPPRLDCDRRRAPRTFAGRMVKSSDQIVDAAALRAGRAGDALVVGLSVMTHSGLEPRQRLSRRNKKTRHAPVAVPVESAYLCNMSVSLSR